MRARDGNERAFVELLERFEGRFRSLVQRMLKKYPSVQRWEATDDVYQNAIIRLHRSLQDASPSTVKEFIGLTATQIRRELIDLARHYYGALGLGKNHHTDGAERNQIVVSAGQAPDSLDDWTDFHQSVANLPPEARESFELIWYAGLTQIEAASLLGISRRTLIRRLNVARRHLSESCFD